MTRVVFCGLCPHPPIIIPEVGRESVSEARRTVEAVRVVARSIAAEDPEVVVMAGPHGPYLRNAVAVLGGVSMRGSLAAFGAPHVQVEVTLDAATMNEVGRSVSEAGLGFTEVKADLDHGFLVPLYFLKEAGVRAPVVLIGPGFIRPQGLYCVGRNMAKNLTKKTAFVASGDLSHRVSRGAPAGYHPLGKEFDEAILKGLSGDKQSLLGLDEDLVEAAGQCGLGPIAMLAGISGEMEFEVLSYEAPFGVGYMVAQSVREHYLVGLAREALETYVREARVISPGKIPDEFQNSKSGAFVSIHDNEGLRGCIGTIQPTKPNLALEVVDNAISAGTRDPRFDQVRPQDLGNLKYSVDVLNEPEPVQGLGELDPKIYGVIVEKGSRRGLLLPDLDGVDTADDQVSIACRKAGISPGEKGVNLYRFRVRRYGKKV